MAMGLLETTNHFKFICILFQPDGLRVRAVLPCYERHIAILWHHANFAHSHTLSSAKASMDAASLLYLLIESSKRESFHFDYISETD